VKFQDLHWFFLAIPFLLALVVVRFWRRHYWGHSLVKHFGSELERPHPVLRLPTILEGSAVVFLLLALCGPVYPFVLDHVERGGLQIMFVFDLSQSMEEPLAAPTANPNLMPQGPSKMEAVRASAAAFARRRPGDAIGLIIFSNNAYMVSPATFDHDSLFDYLRIVSPETLATEGYTAIGEGLALAQQYFAFSREKEPQNKGQIIILFTDGVNNWGRDPLEQIDRAHREGTRIYYIGVALEPGASQGIAAAVPLTGGQFFDVRDPKHLVEAVDAIDKIEKGRFHTLQLVRQQPAYFIFVLLAFAALALRMALNAVPHFVDLS
jgi:Ca-activated chloride channel homolog